MNVLEKKENDQFARFDVETDEDNQVKNVMMGTEMTKMVAQLLTTNAKLK